MHLHGYEKYFNFLILMWTLKSMCKPFTRYQPLPCKCMLNRWISWMLYQWLNLWNVLKRNDHRLFSEKENISHVLLRCDLIKKNSKNISSIIFFYCWCDLFELIWKGKKITINVHCTCSINHIHRHIIYAVYVKTNKNL